MGWMQIAMMIIQLIQFIWPWLAKWLNLEKHKEALAAKIAETAQTQNALPSFTGPNDVKRFADLAYETSHHMGFPLRILARRLAAISRVDPERIWNAAVQQGMVGGTTVPEATYDELLSRKAATASRYGLSPSDFPTFSSEGTMSAPAEPTALAAPLTFSLKRFIETLFGIAEVVNPMSFVFTWLGLDKIKGLLLEKAPDVNYEIPQGATAMPDNIKEQITEQLKKLAGLFSGRPLVVLAINAFISVASSQLLDLAWDKMVEWLNSLIPVPTPIGPAFALPDGVDPDPLGIVALI